MIRPADYNYLNTGREWERRSAESKENVNEGEINPELESPVPGNMTLSHTDVLLFLF